MANTTFTGPVRSLNGFQTISVNSTTGAVTVISTFGPTGSISTTSTISTAITSTSATPGTSRAIYGKYTTASGGMTSGNLVGVRGEITLGGNASGTAYLYGTQGKLIGGTKTINIGSAYAVGVFGQLDVTGTTVTSGYVAGVASDIFGVSSGTVAVDLFYGQHADGGTINSYFRAYGKSTSVFEFDTNGGTQASTAGVSSATNAGYLKIKVDGAVRYINLFSGAPS